MLNFDFFLPIKTNRQVAWPNICAHNSRGEGSLGCSLAAEQGLVWQ